MRKFLYLRIVAILLLVTIISYMVWVLYKWYSDLPYYWYMIILNEFLLLLFAANSLAILFVFQKYYPDKELPKSVIILYRVSSVICILCNLFFAIALSDMVMGMLHLSPSQDPLLTGKKINYSPAVIALIAFVLFIVQLFGGRRLIRTIRHNARAQLENSFS